MSKEIKASAVKNAVRHDNHTAPLSLTKRNTVRKYNYLLVKNRSSTAVALISFDGINSFTIDPKESISLEVSGLTDYWTGGGVVLEVIVAGEE